jgi:hypothetical protein
MINAHIIPALGSVPLQKLDGKSHMTGSTRTFAKTVGASAAAISSVTLLQHPPDARSASRVGPQGEADRALTH